MLDLDVQTVQTVDTGNIQRRLTRDERRVWRTLASTLKSLYAREWTGWRYQGRPSDAPRNVSQAAWKVKIATTEAATLTVTNDARSYNNGQSYVANVHRAGSNTPEALVLQERIEAEILPPFLEDLATVIANNAALPTRPQRRRSTGGAQVRAAGVEL